jgi:hypothetical protein
MYFLFFNFQDFILCVELIILQSSFIRIKKKKPKYFLKIMKEAKVFGFLWKILYMSGVVSSTHMRKTFWTWRTSCLAAYGDFSSLRVELFSLLRSFVVPLFFCTFFKTFKEFRVKILITSFFQSLLKLWNSYSFMFSREFL